MNFKNVSATLVLGLSALTFVACDNGVTTPTTTYYVDADGDTFGSASLTVKATEQTAGLVTDSSDCNDLNSTINTGATEVCDSVDNNCDGQVDEGLTCTAALTTWLKVSAGGMYHDNDYAGRHGGASSSTCAIQMDGTLWCWGDNAYGQLGVGSFATSSVPVQVGTETDWIDVSSAGTRNCGIRGTGEKGTLWCWGLNIDQGNDVPGLLGLGATFDTTTYVVSPTQVGTDADWSSVNIGSWHGTGIRNDGTNKTLWAWGRNPNGALGNNTTTDSNVPVQEFSASTDWASSNPTVMGYSSNQTCAIRDDGLGSRTLWCYGYGTGGFSSNDVPTQFGSDTNWESVASAGAGFACGIKTDHTMYCGGNGRHGQPGHGAFSSAPFTTQITGIGTDTEWTAVSLGRQHVCAINAGKMYCWGRNHDGELGIGNVVTVAALTQCSDDEHDTDSNIWDCHTPTLVDDTKTWTSVSSGYGQTCGKTSTDELYCWGNNQFGSVGAGGVRVDAPTLIAGN